jgi:hypothetical protein
VRTRALQVVGRHPLEQEAGASRAQRGREDLVVVEGRQDENRRGRRVATDRRGRGDAVHVRHPDVHQDDVRPQARHGRGHRRPVTALADDVEAVALARI